MIDDKSKINCKQLCRTRILPASCKADINTYKDAGLFEPSTGRQDTCCANITLVRRSINKSLTKATKADKYIQRQIEKTVHDTLPIDDPSLTPATYRMTIDFRHLNRVTLNDHSTQLPSVQSIQVNFADLPIPLSPHLILQTCFQAFFSMNPAETISTFILKMRYSDMLACPKDGP